MGQFLGPETERNEQFLAPEIVNMGQKNFWSQKLTKWFSFWGQKLYFMGEWNYINKYVKHKFRAPLFGPLILQRKLDFSIADKPIRVYYFVNIAHILSTHFALHTLHTL